VREVSWLLIEIALTGYFVLADVLCYTELCRDEGKIIRVGVSAGKKIGWERVKPHGT